VALPGMRLPLTAHAEGRPNPALHAAAFAFLAYAFVPGHYARMAVTTVKARDLLDDRLELLPAQTLSLVNPLVYSNAGRYGDLAFRRWILWCNTARDSLQPPVFFGRYAAPAYLDGAGPYAVLTRDALVAEQAAADRVAPEQTHRALTARAPDAVAVERPCLLACRHGEWTWGHWLIDMLPKIVLAEWFSPRRFTYVVPASITEPGSGRFYISSVLDSLAAYGLGPDRLLRVEAGKVYKFANLFDIADIVGNGIHPGVLAAMRNLPSLPPDRPRALSAVLRNGAEHRPIVNGAALASYLREQGAAMIDPGATPFQEQIRVFRESAVVVGDLGSNLAASIYARPGLGMVTLAPSGWHDDYFSNIFQRLDVCHADIRGVSLPTAGQIVGHAAHFVNPLDLAEGLQAVRQAVQSPPGAPSIAGRIVARAPGEVVWSIRFGEGGDAAQYQRGLFSPPEGTLTWSMGPTCRIVVPGFKPPGTDCWLEVKGIGFIARPHLLSRALGVVVNGVQLGDFDIDELTHVHVPVPAGVLRGRKELELEFRHPACPSPLAMGVSNDTRPLGFMFERLALRRA
jgi:hypothetical protein